MLSGEVERAGESRKNALWGSGGRGGGRRIAMSALAALTLMVPLSAGAESGNGGKPTFISPGLLSTRGVASPARSFT